MCQGTYTQVPMENWTLLELYYALSSSCAEKNYDTLPYLTYLR